MESKLSKYEKQIKKELNDFLVVKMEREINKMKWQLQQDLEEEEVVLKETESLKRYHAELVDEEHVLSTCYHNTKRLKETILPDTFRPKDKGVFLNYIFDNKLCLYSFLEHYQIKSSEGHSTRCNLSHHNYKGHWHADEMKTKFPLGYSKFAALCQVTHVLYDKGRVEESRKLCRAIWQDKDGFFSSEVAPID